MKRLFMRRHARLIVLGGLISILAMVTLLSCGASRYDYIGTWKEQAGQHTYVNNDQNMSIAFPVDGWQVYTQPTGEVKNIWDMPLWNDSALTVLIATAPQNQMVQVIVEPNRIGLLFDDYLQAVKWNIDSAYGATRDITWKEPRDIEHGGRTVGILDYSYDPDETIMAVIDDRTRYVLISYSCPRGEFNTHEDEFWSIVDSFRSLNNSDLYQSE